MNKQALIKISGQVQGVTFRWNTQRQARALGLTGWVKNEPDGGVTIVAQGEEDKIKQLVVWAEQGPAAAQVEEVKVNWVKSEDNFTDFTINF